MANLGLIPGVLPAQRTGNKNAASRAQAGAGKPGTRAEVLARLKEQAKTGAAADAALFAQWDAEPDTEFDTPEAFEQHKEAVNENRAATGERKIY